MSRIKPAFPDGHFYSPYPDADELLRREAQVFDRTKEPEGVDLRSQAQTELVRDVASMYRDLPFTEEGRPGLRYRFDNRWYSYSDAILLHLLLRYLQPRRLIEIGSGWSSAVTLDTIDCFSNDPPKVTMIDPFPDRLYAVVGNSLPAYANLIEQPLQEAELSVFDSLGRGDILFVDSTHVSKAGSDVNWLFFRVLPRLKPGVVVHLHDIFYPFEYPKNWVLEGRAWTENYLLHAFLQYNREFEILLWGHYLHVVYAQLMADALPLTRKNFGGCFWMRRRV